MKILHLSDLHNDFGILKVIQERYPDHYVIFTGDITDNGSQDEYFEALAALWPFKGRIYLCPGNHDYRMLGNIIVRDKATYFDKILSVPLNQHGFFSGDNIPVVNRVEDTLFIALDSNLEMGVPYWPFEFASGEIGPKQLEVLDKILGSPVSTKVLFMHHHPFIRNNPFMFLRDSEKLHRVIEERVDVMLFGHRHDQEYWQGRWGVDHILAAGKASEESTIAEITIEDNISIKYLEV